MKIAVVGALGRMGSGIVRSLHDDDISSESQFHIELVESQAHPQWSKQIKVGDVNHSLLNQPSVDVDLIVDFSHAANFENVLNWTSRADASLISGTTGLSNENFRRFEALGQRCAVLWASNFSRGVNLLFALAKIAARSLPDFDAEIVEMHHRFKVDAPSGTALTLAEQVIDGRGWSHDAICTDRHQHRAARETESVGVVAMRGGSVVGDHQLVLASNAERLELVHRAQDRQVFIDGVVSAVHWIADKPAGVYQMADVLGLNAQ